MSSDGPGSEGGRWRDVDRRTFLRATGAIGAAGLAGCSDSGSGQSDSPAAADSNTNDNPGDSDSNPEQMLEAHLLDGEGTELTEAVLEQGDNITVSPGIEAENVEGEYGVLIEHNDETTQQLGTGNITTPEEINLAYGEVLDELEVGKEYSLALHAEASNADLSAEDTTQIRIPFLGDVSLDARIETWAEPGQEGVPVDEREYNTQLKAEADIDVNADVDTYRLVLEKEEGEDIELATAESGEEIQIDYEEITEHIDEYGEQTITAEVEKNGETLQRSKKVEVSENPEEGLFENTGELIREAMQNYHNPETSTFRVNATEPLRKVAPEAWENGFEVAGALYDLSQGSDFFAHNDFLDLSKQTNWTMGTRVVELEDIDSETLENKFLEHLNEYDGERSWRTIEAGERELDVHMLRYEIEEFDTRGRQYWIVDEQNERVFVTGDTYVDDEGYETWGLETLKSALRASYGEEEDIAGERGLLESGLLDDFDVVNFTYGGIPSTFSLDFDKFSESDARGTFTVLSEDGTELKEYPVRLEDGEYQIITDSPIGEMEPQSISFGEYAQEWNGR